MKEAIEYARATGLSEAGRQPEAVAVDSVHVGDPLTCLFITASTSACAGEAKLVRDCLQNLGIGFREVEWISPDDFRAQMSKGEKYDFIYLGAHADGNGFGQNDKTALHPWETLAVEICTTDCIRPNGTLFLGCCRGGMKAVAIKILSNCNTIDYICGPHWKVAGNDLTAAFQAFVQSRIRKREEPCKAAERATEACGFRFSCYDRQELLPEIETAWQMRNLEWEIMQVRSSQISMQSQLELIAKALGVAASTVPAPSQAAPANPPAGQPIQGGTRSEVA
jgi:hypothetical protein